MKPKFERHRPERGGLTLLVDYYMAAEVDAYFANAVDVFGCTLKDQSITKATWYQWADGVEDKEATHRALLVGITKIKEETAEDLLREVIESERDEGKYSDKCRDAIERARAYLERKAGK